MNRAEKIIRKFAKELEIELQGNEFYTPKQWADRKELYGLNSELIVCHGDSELDYICCYENDLFDNLQSRLGKAGYMAEPQTNWYLAIYKN